MSCVAQYENEDEVLFSPLAGLEVLRFYESTDAAGKALLFVSARVSVIAQGFEFFTFHGLIMYIHTQCLPSHRVRPVPSAH